MHSFDLEAKQGQSECALADTAANQVEGPKLEGCCKTG